MKSLKIAFEGFYAQTVVVVTLIVVNIFGVLVITRHHGSFAGRLSVEILSIGLPDLSATKFEIPTAGIPKS